jgi:uncharacterized protein
LKIRLPAYPNGLHRIEAFLNPADLDLDTEVFFSPLLAKLDLDRRDPYLKFHFVVEGDVRLTCDRCLAIYEYELRAEGPMLYVVSGKPRGEEIDDPEISYIALGVNELDITPDLRDLVILTFPERHLCSDDCKGLCAGCGADLNTEPCACG